MTTPIAEQVAWAYLTWAKPPSTKSSVPVT